MAKRSLLFSAGLGVASAQTLGPLAGRLIYNLYSPRHMANANGL